MPGEKGNLINERSSTRKVIKTLVKKTYYFYLRIYGKTMYKPSEVIYVPTQDINNILVSPGKPSRRRFLKIFNIKVGVRVTGLILNGDWDLNKKKINDLLSFAVFKKRYLEGKEWEETSYYDKYKNRIKVEGMARQCKTWKEFKQKKLMIWDELFKDIKDNGYKKQSDPDDEIEVGVSREGEIILIDGQHRFAIAKILNLEEIPVVVNYWHKEYLDKVKSSTATRKLTPVDAIRPALENHASN